MTLAEMLDRFGAHAATAAAGVVDGAPDGWMARGAAAIAAAAAAALIVGGSAWAIRRRQPRERRTAGIVGDAVLRSLPAAGLVVVAMVGLAPLLAPIPYPPPPPPPIGDPAAPAAGPVGNAAVLWLELGALIVIAARCAYRIVGRLAERFRSQAAASSGWVDDIAVEAGARLARGAVVIAAIYLALGLLPDTPRWQAAGDRIFGLLVVGLIAWALITLVGIGERYVALRYRTDVPDNLAARRITTQIVVLRRLAYLGIGVLAVSLALMQFESIRHIGTSLLASAGLAGVIIGFAAQRTLGNLLAGIQIALTQPIRIDDVVIMEGEWGRIEEITLTYVVVAIWDQRRLIVPLSKVIESPFQNWTRTGSALLAPITLQCDHRVAVDAVRRRAEELVRAHPLWDGRVAVIHVTDWKERAVEIRVLASANDAGKAFDLRCAVREGLLTWMQSALPGALPRLHVAADAAGPASTPARPATT